MNHDGNPLTPRQLEILDALRKFETDAKKGTKEEVFRAISEFDQKYGDDPTYAGNIDGVLTNIGSATRNLPILSHARERLVNRLATNKGDLLAYNLGNALQAIGDIKCNGSLEELLEGREYREARGRFSAISTGPHFPEATTNLANILEKYGRTYEALHVYEGVLKRKPDFGMALGNKGVALSFYFSLVSDKSLNLLRQASELLKKAVEEEESTIKFGGREAADHFRRELARVDGYLSRQGTKKPPSKQTRACLTKYQRFSMERNLFLNSCFNCFRCKKGFTDSLNFYFIDQFKAGTDESDYRHSGYSEKTYYSIKTLNQIYEDFAGARYLYYHAVTVGFRGLDRITRYNSALDYCFNSLRYGLVKTSYIRLFNILDKIAHLVFMNYGIPGDDHLYYRHLSSSAVADVVKREKSWGLLALHNLAGDFTEGRIYNRLVRIRHLITHEFIDIGLVGFPARNAEDQYYSERHLSEEQLHSYTEDLFLLVKSALVYFVNALFEDYRKQWQQQGSPLPLHIYPQRDFY